MTERGVSTRLAFALLALGSLGYALFAFAWFTFAAFLTPITADLGLSSTAAGVVNGAVPLTYIPIALASGLVIDRVGASRAIGAGLAILGVAQFLRSTAGGFPDLLLFTALLGVGGTGITFGLPKLVSEVVPTDRTGSGTSVYVVGASLGTAAAFSLGRPVLGPLLGGWRPVFRWSGIAVVCFAVVWLVVARLALGDAVRPDEPDRSIEGVEADVRAVVGNRGMWLLVVVGTAYLMVMHGTQGWVATVFEARGLSAGIAAGLTTLLVVARTAGVLAIPPLSDVIGVRRGIVVACGGLIALGVGGLVVSGASLWLSGAAVVIAGLGAGGLSPLIRTLPIELPGVGPRLTATATGLIFAVGEVGGFLGPFLVGTLYDATGSYAPGLGLLAAAGLVIVAMGVLLPETANGRDGAD